MKRIVILKLGGSLITDKNKPLTPRISVIHDLARQIKNAQQRNPSLQLIIGNGGGSYGHFQAVKHQMTQGITNEKQTLGFCFVQDAVAQLNRIVVAELLKVEIRACSLHPSSSMIADNGRLKQFFAEPLTAFLNLGIVPVFYGDIITDRTKGASIFSTEYLINILVRYLVKQYRAKVKVIHCGLVAGVLDQKGKVVPQISKGNINQIQKLFVKSQGFDVTGGMRHKVEESLRLTKYGVESLIISGSGPGDNLTQTLLGRMVEGTLITA